MKAWQVLFLLVAVGWFTPRKWRVYSVSALLVLVSLVGT
jgi:hypothetical protein